MGEMVEMTWWNSAYGTQHGDGLYGRFRSQFGHGGPIQFDSMIECRECKQTFPAGTAFDSLQSHECVAEPI
jgi:hypothetical protein